MIPALSCDAQSFQFKIPSAPHKKCLRANALSKRLIKEIERKKESLKKTAKHYLIKHLEDQVWNLVSEKNPTFARLKQIYKVTAIFHKNHPESYYLLDYYCMAERRYKTAKLTSRP